MNTTKSTSLVSVLFLLSISARVHAGGFATARFGAEWGHVTADHPTAIYYNPAGLSLGVGTRLYLEGVFAYRSASYTRPSAAIDNITDDGIGTPTADVGANSGEATLSNLLASPFLGISSDLGIPNLAIGAAFYAPFGGQAKWDKDSRYQDSSAYTGAVDGSQRWSTIEGTIRAVYLSAAAAYRLPNPKLSFGLSVNVVRQSVNTLRARNAAGSDDLVRADGTLVEGRSLLDASGTSLSIGAGVIWQPQDNLWLGASYQSQPGFGETEQDGVLSNKFGSLPVDDVPVSLVQSLPDLFRIGGRYRPTADFEIRLDADYTRWSFFQDQCLIDRTNSEASCVLDGDGGNTPDTVATVVNVHRGWNDNFGIHLGASYWPTPHLELAGGFKFDSDAIPDETLDPALMDMNKGTATGGLRWNFSERLRLNVAYTHVFYALRNVDVRDAPPPDPSRVPDQAGRYKQSVGLINLGIEAAF